MTPLPTPGKMSHAALTCHDLSAAYHHPTRPVFHGVSLQLPLAKWTCIVGPNGAGKSSLLMALAGLMPYTEGAVELLGRPLNQWGRKDLARAMAWLGQRQPSADDLSVHDVVMLGRIPHQGWLAVPTEADLTAVEQAMAATQCASWRDRGFGDLSGGEQQRVLLARALAVQASVYLMDEPLSNLDPPHQADWLFITKNLIGQGKTVVSVLHELPFALQADALVVMDKGIVLHQGPANAPDTHKALETVFEHRVAIHQVAGQWTAIPRM